MRKSNDTKRHGAGRQRNTKEIRIWLFRNDLTMQSVARSVGLPHSTVWETLAGRRNSRRVLGYLLGIGCPRDILSLPDDMQTAA